jgi:GMP synthase (glutamine-hydrolysing)
MAFQNANRYIKDGKVMYSQTDLKETYDYFLERLIFSATYATVIKEALGRMGLSPENSYLGQGTLYTDIIESGHSGAHTATIKPHHNIGGAFSAWQDAGKLVQPLDYFFKDDVRAIGSELGLPDDFVWRQPFPGPGLLVRVLNLWRSPDFKNKDQAERAIDEFRSPDDAIHILPLRATGNPGDGPEYKNMVAITSDDGLQSRHYDIARALPNTVRDIGGVVFIEGGKVPQQADVYNNVIPTDLGVLTMDLAREVDAAVEEVSAAHGLGRLLAQEPVALSAYRPYGTDGRLAMLRPVDTVDFFTAQAARPGSRTFPEAAYHEQVEAALSVKGIGGVAIDLSDKPPRTIEYK